MGAQNTNCTMKFIDIPEDRQREAINTVALQTGLPPSSIEAVKYRKGLVGNAGVGVRSITQKEITRFIQIMTMRYDL